MMFVLITYDISDNKRRRKLTKILLDYGNRVQLSVFEFTNLRKTDLQKLLSRIRRITDVQKDRVRVYKICTECFKQIEVFGKGNVTKDEEVYIF